MLLKEQGTLQTPVGTFSARHDAGLVEPEQAKFYKRLIPLSRPGAGEQYAFKVDLDRCTGCKACVSACHSLNGLEESETWRDVGTIHGIDLAGAAYSQTITTACHHCTDPGCLNGCPVLAYEKDPKTGIVYHLDDQCIGCQYCVLKCPYDVPKYSKKLGIVRKCDMCQSRLANGEAPACAQACPTEAISITIVDIAATEAQARGTANFLPGAPEPSYTVPTTQYVSGRDVPSGAVAADYHTLRPEHGHLPLVFMLVLTQLSVGLFAFAFFGAAEATKPTLTAGFLAMSVGLAASVSHLGRPLGAWRAFLGLRRSWLSREIVTFGLFSGAAAVYTLTAYVDFIPALIERASGPVTLALGLLGVFTSVMIYHDTQRPFWFFPIGAIKFYGTTMGLAAAAYLPIAVACGVAVLPAFSLLVFSCLVKLGLEVVTLWPAFGSAMKPARKSALLMLRPLRVLTGLRFLSALGGLLIALGLTQAPTSLALAIFAFILILISELLERTLFFRAVAAPKMPGGVA